MHLLNVDLLRFFFFFVVREATGVGAYKRQRKNLVVEWKAAGLTREIVAVKRASEQVSEHTPSVSRNITKVA